MDDNEDCKIIVILSQNLNCWGEIKNNLMQIYNHICKFYPLPYFKLIFGKNKTNLQEIEFQSCFYLTNLPKECEILTKNSMGKIIAEHENIIYTRLDFENNEYLFTFIDFYEQLNEDIGVPNWFKEVNI